VLLKATKGGNSGETPWHLARHPPDSHLFPVSLSIPAFQHLHIMLPLKLHMPCLVLFSLLFAIAFYQTFISEKTPLEYEPLYAFESA
jgi:hypothetical protein